MQAGEALIFDHSLLHASTLHNGPEPRLALTFGLCKSAAPMRFWYRHEAENELECLQMPDDFFLRYHQIGQRPAFASSIGRYRQDQSALSKEEAENMLGGGFLERKIERVLRPDLPVLVNSVEKITRNLDANVSLANDGYALIPLLDEAEVQALKAFFERKKAAEVDRFYASVHSPDLDFRMEMDAKIREVLQPKLSQLLNEAELLGSSFIAKPKGGAGILPPHADWNIVDERFFRSYNLWIPLVDTTVANGAVHIIPGSHNWWDYFRGPGIPNPFAAHKDLIWKAMQPLEMKAGTALLYDHRLLHASPINQTDELRLACVSGIKPKAAKMFFYLQDQQGIKAYKSTPEFYMQGNPENGPGSLEFYEHICAHQPDLTEEELRKFLGNDVMISLSENTQIPPAPQAQRSFWQTYTPGNIMREIRWRLKGRS
jgi:ectoine hydroxylase-related dioxygenase (phytanoyl-CoA dioxygenase family)